MRRLFNRIKAMVDELKWLKTKPCAACRYFVHYWGSAGVCEARNGCPTLRMIDYDDTCNCGMFKRKRK